MPQYLTPAQQHPLDLVPPRPLVRHEGAAEVAQVRTVWHVLRAHRLMIALFIVGFAAAAAIYSLLATPVYEVSASIRVDPKIQSAQDVLQSMAATAPGDAAINDLATEMEMLQSRSLAEDVTDSLGLGLMVAEPRRVPRLVLLDGVKTARDVEEANIRLDRQPDGRFKISADTALGPLPNIAIGEKVTVAGATFTLLRGAADYPTIKLSLLQFDDAVDAVRKHLKITRAANDANLIDMAFKGPDPVLARNVLNTVAADFIRNRQNVQKTEARTTIAYLRDQLDTLSRELVTSENALQKFREDEHVIDPQAEASSGITRQAQLEADRATLDDERRALAKLVAEVETAVAVSAPGAPSPYRRLVAFPTLFRDVAVGQLLQSLSTVEEERTQLLQRRTPADPDVQVLTERQHDLERNIRTIATTYLEGLQNQETALDSTIRAYRGQLGEVPHREVEFARLDRRPKVLDELAKMLQTRLKEAEIVQAASDPSVRLVDPAILPIQPSQPKPVLYVVLAVLAGAFAGVAAALTRQYFDRAVHGSAEMRLATGLPVLGVIPSISGPAKRQGRRATAGGKSFKALMAATEADATSTLSDAMPSDAAAGIGQMVAGQAFERLQTNIRFIRPDTGVKTLLVTSPLPGDGKTTTAVNLALSLAQSGYVTALVDGDLRRGLVASMFDVPRSPGLSELLRGFSKLEDVLKSVAVGEGGILYYLTSGTLPPNPTRLLESDALRLLVADLASRCDVVIIDSPPLNAVHDAALLASVADGVILVARAGVTTIEAIGYAMDQLRTVHAPVLGTVLNDADLERDTAYGGGYAYRWQDSGAGAVGTQ